MSQRSAFQIQILEKLGAPLVSAVSEVSARNGGDDESREAARVAELLAKAVQVSISLAGAMDLKESGEQADAIRLALAALAGPLLAGFYRETGKVPGDNDIKRMIKALEAALSFSDNFAPAADNAARLENIEPGMLLADESQTSIRAVNALVPVVGAIAAFSFGRPETKLVQEVTDRLVGRATSLREIFMPGAPEQAAKRAELGLLTALAAIYVECHKQETARLMGMDEQARTSAAEAAGGMLPMDPVWAAFDLRAGMIELIGKNTAPAGAAAGGGVAPAPPPRAAAEPPIQQAPPESPPAPPSQPQEPPAVPPPSEEQGGDGAFNPMGFFKPGSKPAADDFDSEDV